MTSLKEVKAASLLLDFNLYPRHKVDRTHVLHIRSALRAEEEMPPVIADKATKRVVDGTHRVISVLDEFGDDATICVEFRTYATEADIIEDAVRLNTGHGSNLTPHDRVRCIVLAQEYGLSADRLADALRSPLAEVEILKTERVGKVRGGDHPIPIKQGLKHLTRGGRKITKKQADGMADAGALNRTYYVNEVIRTLEYDLADWENPKFVERLIRLRDLLNDLNLNQKAVF